MKKRSIKEAPWYPNAVAACFAVTLLVVLFRFPDVWAGVRKFFGFFRPVILGCVIAYIVNPLSKLLERTVFAKVKKEKVRLGLSNALAFFFVLLLLAFSFMILIPQLIESVKMLAENLDGYIASLNKLIERWGIKFGRFDISTLISSSESLLDKIGEYLSNNISQILEVSANAGKGLLQWVIAFILSIYLLGDKRMLKAGLKRLFNAAFTKEQNARMNVLLRESDMIFTRYIVFNLIDSLIIGAVTAIFMASFGMQYVGLISFVVAITNLVPTFGPLVGEVVGAFILLMVKPSHALIFLICELLLQGCDGYIIKPKLFGNSLGVSGLWILVGVIVGGNMFGVAGILLAIPIVAIIDFSYSNYFMPWLEARRDKRNGAAGDDPAAVREEDADPAPGEPDSERIRGPVRIADEGQKNT
ncbi:MAG: AI-2E family transporter [Lachnospiraceae bacterium]|nr:AI-2E family transporter [Lachnospiraceae bacterium]